MKRVERVSGGRILLADEKTSVSAALFHMAGIGWDNFSAEIGVLVRICYAILSDVFECCESCNFPTVGCGVWLRVFRL